MRVFITGATGNIGSAVLAELLNAGHTATALARSEESAARLAALGVDVAPGELSDTDVLTGAAAKADGVIHLAFGHDFTAFAESIAEEGRVIEALGRALVGSDRPFLIASGTPATVGRASNETDSALTDGPAGGRARNANSVLDLAEHGVRSAVIRLPRTVHNRARGGFAGMLTAVARRTGTAGYPGDGSQRWPAVHTLDAARLFRIALEQAAAGTVLHAVADEGDPVRDIAQVIGTRLGLPVGTVPAETFGPLGAAFTIDQPSTSTLTRSTFGWQPTQPSLLEDLATFLEP